MLRKIARDIALSLPPVKGLAVSRNDALRALAESRESNQSVARQSFRAFLNASSADTWLHVTMNDAALWLPRDTLRTMYHCLHMGAEDKLVLNVEETHLHWMMNLLANGGTFLDVGCATGATSLPIALAYGAKVKIVAYEPAEAARSLLTATMARNKIGGIDIRPVAVSDKAGTAEFREFLQDETGAMPYMPETSSLIGAVIGNYPHRTVQVGVVTLDDNALSDCQSAPVVIKIDVEGFEVSVLRGAVQLIDGCKPWLSIDIHADPFGDGIATTEKGVRDFLKPYGYSFEKINHVLLCSPATAPGRS